MPPVADNLSPLESRVMDILWRRGTATAGDVLNELGSGLSNASVRTLLRRIEAKGCAGHRTEGRAFVYFPTVAATAAAQGAVTRVMRRFYGGSVEQLVQGLLDGKLIDRARLERLAERVDAAARSRKGS